MQHDLLERSEYIISKILAFLVKQGVKKTDVLFLDIGTEFESSEIEWDDVGLFFDAMFWLDTEGIIRHQVATTSGFHGCTLTAYGFSMLGQTFDGGQGKETVGSAIKKVSDSGKSYAGLGDFVGGVLGGFTKSMGNG